MLVVSSEGDGVPAEPPGRNLSQSKACGANSKGWVFGVTYL